MIGLIFVGWLVAAAHGGPQDAEEPSSNLTRVVDERKATVCRGGLVFSQRVMLALTQAGVSREDAYAAVQENAMKVWRGEGRFIDFLKADARVTLPDADLEALFDLGYHTKHVDTVFARVFGEPMDDSDLVEIIRARADEQPTSVSLDDL